jgi:hypothetical protein
VSLLEDLGIQIQKKQFAMLALLRMLHVVIILIIQTVHIAVFLYVVRVSFPYFLLLLYFFTRACSVNGLWVVELALK